MPIERKNTTKPEQKSQEKGSWVALITALLDVSLIWGFFLLFGAILFICSFCLEDTVAELEAWLPSVGTVMEVQYEENDNPDWHRPNRTAGEPEQYGRETIQYEYIRADGSTGTGIHVRDELNVLFPGRSEVGETLDVLYDPYDDQSIVSESPDLWDQIKVHLMRWIGVLMVVVLLGYKVRRIFQKTRYKKSRE